MKKTRHMRYRRPKNGELLAVAIVYGMIALLTAATFARLTENSSREFIRETPTAGVTVERSGGTQALV
jgi:hypothetical protein